MPAVTSRPRKQRPPQHTVYGILYQQRAFDASMLVDFKSVVKKSVLSRSLSRITRSDAMYEGPPGLFMPWGHSADFRVGLGFVLAGQRHSPSSRLHSRSCYKD